jgi:hypothetical protein
MLVELSVVEQRYLAVREALDTGATIIDVARQGRRERLGELRRVRLPGRQPLPWPDCGRSSRGRHRPGHAGRQGAANPPSSPRQDQGVRSLGHTERKAPEGSECRIGTGPTSRQGYRVLTAGGTTPCRVPGDAGRLEGKPARIFGRLCPCQIAGRSRQGCVEPR